MIYFDNAATSLPKPPEVAQAVLEGLQTFGGPGRGCHAAAMAASRCVFRCRQALAALMGSTPERTVFTMNATESLNMAIEGLLAPGDHAITTALEHNSVLRPLYRLRGKGMGLSIVPLDAHGGLDYSAFARCLAPHTKAVVCTHASNLTGAVTDLSFVGDFCRKHGLLFILDASQTAGVFPIAADKMGIDALCFTGHKGLLGPQGTGGLCLGAGITIPPYKVGGSGIHSLLEDHPAQMPEALEAGTLNAHGIAGLLAGITYMQRIGMDRIRSHELALARRFQEGAARLPCVKLYGGDLENRAPIVTLNIGSAPSGEVGDLLARQYDICVRAGSHCAPLAHAAFGTQEQGAVRFSFSFFNTEEEIETGIRAIAQIAQALGET